MDKRLYDLVWGTTLRTTTRVHKVVHRLSGGRLGRRFPGGQRVVWVTTLGRKSGQWRTNPLLAIRDAAVEGSGSGEAVAPPQGLAAGDAFVVTGSNAGQAKVPGWVFNVRANPDGYLTVDGDAWAVRFEESEGDDRDALFARLVAIWKSYAMYEENAGRYIPVFRVRLLQRVAADSVPASA